MRADFGRWISDLEEPPVGGDDIPLYGIGRWISEDLTN